MPTKAGAYTVAVTAALATNAKKTWVFKVPLRVVALPWYAKGTYNGGGVSLTVGATGKISGTFLEYGTNWTLSAASYTWNGQLATGNGEPGGSPSSATADVFICSNVVAKYSWTVKSGKKTVTKSLTRTFALAVSEGMSGDAALGFASADEILPDGAEAPAAGFDAWQNRWASDYAAVGKALFWTSAKVPSKTWESVAADGLGEYDTLSLTVASSGAVTAKYKYFKGTFDAKTGARQYATYSRATAIIPTSPADAESFTGYVPVVFPADAAGFPGFAAEVKYPFGE